MCAAMFNTRELSSHDMRVRVCACLQPEPVEYFKLQLLASSVTGGAKIGGITEATVLVEDSDDIHGLVQFAADSEQVLDTVSVCNDFINDDFLLMRCL